MTCRPVLSSLMLVALSACSLAPPTRLPAAPIPKSWPIGDAYLAHSEAALPVLSYKQVFTDPRLQQIIETALANNQNLKAAAANLEAARAQVKVTRSAQFPEVDTTGAVSSTRTSTTSSASLNNGSQVYYSVQGGVSSYELDFLGKLANATAAQRDQMLATEAAARAVRLGLVSNIASAWATYAADSDLLAIARQTATNARQSVRLTRARLNGGIAPRTDLAQAQQVLASAEQAIGVQTTALAQDRNLLRLLVGADIKPALLPHSLAGIADTYATVPAGLNSRILLRRPDVIQAEYQLRAANANIGVARAKLFPSLSLTGLLGFASNALSSLFTDGAFHFSAGANATYAIFGGGKRANVHVTEAQRDAALANYEETIQTAFRETADALADQGTLGQRLKAAKDNVQAANTSERLTRALYKAGVDNFLSSLVAQRSLFAARQQMVNVELASLRNRVTLYQVLGGDQASTSAAK